jgi:hypothetical protein
MKRRNSTGSSRVPSRFAHRARPIRQYPADATSSRLLPPSPPTRGLGFLQLQPCCCDSKATGSFHPRPVKQRLVAHPPLHHQESQVPQTRRHRRGRHQHPHAPLRTRTRHASRRRRRTPRPSLPGHRNGTATTRLTSHSTIPRQPDRRQAPPLRPQPCPHPGKQPITGRAGSRPAPR